MKIKYHKRRKRIYRILRWTEAVIIGAGVIGAIGRSWKSTGGMSLIWNTEHIPAGLAAIAIGYVIGRTVRYIEKRRRILGKMDRKSNKK